MPQSIGTALSSFGNFASTVPSMLGTATSGIPPQAAEAAAAGLPASVPSSLPIAGSAGLPSELPPTSSMPADTGGVLSTPGAFAAPSGFSLLPPNLGLPSGLSIDPVTGAPVAPITGSASSGAPAGGTAAPIDWSTALANWLKGDVTGAKGALGSPISALGTLGNVIEAYNRWQTMRTLQDPTALAKGASQLYQPMSKALKRNIIAPVTAAAQETGQINAPGLYSQSVASALAPYQYEMQMNALNEYIRALQESGGAYPQGGTFGGGLVPQGIYGGEGAKTVAGI